MMKIEEAKNFIKCFVESTKPALGEVDISFSEPLDAAIFPDELPKLKSKLSGMYLTLQRKIF